MILDGQAQAKYDSISDMEFSADGKHLAYLAHVYSRGNMVVRDGQPGPVFDEIEWRPLSDRTSLFTPDGRHILYQAKARRQALCCPG